MNPVRRSGMLPGSSPGRQNRGTILDETTARNDGYLYPELKAVAGSMEPGQISGPIEAKGEFVIVNCMDKKTNRYQSYADVKDKIRTAYMDERYEEIIDKLVGKAHVQIN